MVFLIAMFMTFGALDYWVVMVKHQQAEHIMHRYLQRMQVEGYLTAADETAMLQAYNDIGCPVVAIEGPRESQGAARVTRNLSTNAYVELKVTTNPTPNPLFAGTLIGGNSGDDTFRIIVGGRMLSERVNP